MSYSENFPSIRPSFQFNADAGRLDPRISYSRSTTGTFFGTAKHESSQNLAAHNNDLTNFSNDRLDITSGQTSPSGASDAFKLAQELGSTSAGYCGMQSLSVTSGQRYVYSVYAKAGTNRDYIRIAESLSGSAGKNSYFNLSTGATGTVHADHNATITAVGSSGWYRVSISFTPDASRTGYILNYVTETDNSGTVTDNQGFIYMYGLQLEERDSGGPTVYNATSGQIHREYAPTLQTAAINAPRFEHSASDSASMGLLIEGQATNINTYSKGGVNGSGVVQWQVDNGSATGNSAVGPDGTLSALHFVPNTTTTAHYAYNNAGSAPSGSTPHTISVYAKAAGYSDIVIRLTSSYSAFANTINATFTLTGDGSVSVTGGTATAAIESCGNGWYRCQVTETTSSSPTGMRPYIYAKQVASYAGDGFSGVLLWGWQVEANSFASSFVDTGTSGSTATRAADSAAMVDSSLFDNGSGALAAEYDMFAASETSYVAHLNKTSGGTNGGGVAITNRYVYVENNYLNVGNLSSNTFHKVAASWEPTSQKISRNGGAAAEDTSTVVPSGIDKLYIGQRQDGGEPVNGHIKRLAIYSEPLSSTNLQALTS